MFDTNKTAQQRGGIVVVHTASELNSEGACEAVWSTPAATQAKRLLPLSNSTPIDFVYVLPLVESVASTEWNGQYLGHLTLIKKPATFVITFFAADVAISQSEMTMQVVVWQPCANAIPMWYEGLLSKEEETSSFLGKQALVPTGTVGEETVMVSESLSACANHIIRSAYADIILWVGKDYTESLACANSPTSQACSGLSRLQPVAQELVLGTTTTTSGTTIGGVNLLLVAVTLTLACAVCVRMARLLSKMLGNI